MDIDTLLSPAELRTADGLYESIGEPALNPELLPDSIDGYQLLERIGEGGMGVVYRARQLTANRIVALKLIRADRLQHVAEATRSAVLERFRVEAQATARLDHPNVVRIFEVNTNNPVQPWFSMQFVEGHSLAEHLAGGPVDSRTAAEFSCQISRAIASAHDRGILHRDLKPQNVFLRTNGKHVLVGDFGLAKLSGDDIKRTSDDDILGTPAYMSPEQIRNAAAVSESTDIWSIGATLYHLLTGRPPFQAASSMETLQHVLEHEPTSPRHLNPAVARDIETVCLKCLQKNPRHRYPTASALADDLVCFLSGRPITARPASRVEHVLRWCRRNPLAAVLAGSSLAGIMVAILSLWIGYRTAASALLESDQSHLLARQTVNELFTEVNETTLLDKPDMQPLRKRLLERVLRFYHQFVENGRDSSELVEESGEIWFRIGRIEKELGRLDKAEHALLKALTIQQALKNMNPTTERGTALASTWNDIGCLHIAKKQWGRAADGLMKAVRLREQLSSESPADDELKRLYANTVMNLGAVHRNRAEFVDAVNAFEIASRLQRWLLKNDSTNSRTRRQVRRDLGMALFSTADSKLDMGASGDEVLRPVNESISLFLGLLDEQPDSYADRRRLITCRQLKAKVTPDAHAAALSAGNAADEMEQLVTENPAVPTLVQDWVQLQLLSGRLFATAKLHTDALARFDAVVHALKKPGEEYHPYQGSAQDHAIADAEAALLAVRLSSPDVTIRLTQSKKLLALAAAGSVGDDECVELQKQVEMALKDFNQMPSKE